MHKTDSRTLILEQTLIDPNIWGGITWPRDHKLTILQAKFSLRLGLGGLKSGFKNEIFTWNSDILVKNWKFWQYQAHTTCGSNQLERNSLHSRFYPFLSSPLHSLLSAARAVSPICMTCFFLGSSGFLIPQDWIPSIYVPKRGRDFLKVAQG